MNLTAEQIADLVAGTQRDLGRNKFQDISLSLQDYIVMKEWLKKDKIQFSGGTGIDKNVKVTGQNSAKFVGMYGVDSINVISMLKKMVLPWRHATNYWTYNTVAESMNTGDPAKTIVDLVKLGRVDCMQGLTTLMEDGGLTCPDVADETSPMGLPYWIVKNSSTGFYGGAPSGHTLVGGLNPTTYPNWKNYTGTYVNVSKADLIAQMKLAYDKCNFISPVDIQDYTEGNGQRFQFLMNLTTRHALEAIGESQNDNLGNDIASNSGLITFRKHPCKWVPKLDADTQNPVYGVDHSTFYPVVLSGQYLRETAPMMVSSMQHNLWVVWIDITFNFACINRRANFVLYIA